MGLVNHHVETGAALPARKGNLDPGLITHYMLLNATQLNMIKSYTGSGQKQVSCFAFWKDWADFHKQAMWAKAVCWGYWSHKSFIGEGKK